MRTQRASPPHFLLFSYHKVFMKQSNSQRQRHTHKQELGTQLELTTHGLQVAMAILAEKGLAEFEEAVRKEMDENPALEEKDGR